MTINDIISLTNAGFTKDDIYALTGDTAQKVQIENQAHENPTPVAQNPTPVAQNPTPVAQNPTPVMTDEQIKALAQALNLGNASIDVPKAVTIDDKMKEHFTNILLGKE